MPTTADTAHITINPIDILIPLGQGSRQQDIELRYCLRSVEKHLKGVRHVWLVGECPTWVDSTRVVHVPVPDDPSNTRRAWNIYRKIMAGIKHTGKLNFYQTDSDVENNEVTVYNDPLSDTFLFMNDDHYLLQDYVAAEFPYYHRGRINTHIMEHRLPQFEQYLNTLSRLPSDQRNDYGVHCPMVIDKQSFCGLTGQWLPRKWPTNGFEIKSMYGNWFESLYGAWVAGNKNTCIFIDDLKFSAPAFPETIHRVLEGRPWFSVGDATLKSGGMRQVLQELYPWPSRYEKQEAVPVGGAVAKAN